jgi:hypothetical protein
VTNEHLEIALRVVLFLSGAWVAGHHFLASNALTKAPHKVKLLLMPATVICGIGMCHGAWFYGSGVAILWCAPAVVFMSTTEFMVWRAGAFISTAFAQQEEIKEARRRDFNRMKYDLMAQAETLNPDIRTEAPRRDKEFQ